MVTQFWEDKFFAVWPNKRSRAAHLYLKGAGNGDTSLCGLPQGPESKPSMYRYDAICTRCWYKAKNWKPERKTRAARVKAKKAAPKRAKLPPLPVLEPLPKLNWTEIKKLKTLGSMRVVFCTPRTMVLEEPPGRRLYHFGQKLYHLPFPWLYYGVNCADARFQHYVVRHLSCAPKQLVTPNDTLHYVPLPNIYGWRPCYNGSSGGLSATEGVMDAIGIWWNEVANTDNLHAIWNDPVLAHLRALGALKTPVQDYNYGPVFHKMLAMWESLSDEEALALPWRQSPSTFQKLHPSLRRKRLVSATKQAA